MAYDTDYPTGLPPQMRSIETLLGILMELGGLAVDHAQGVAERRKAARRPRKGATLRPGVDTPLWCAVLEKIRPHLRVRGAQANLARVLELPRQRVHDYFIAGTQMPDAERMIHVLLWLAARENSGGAAVPLKSPKPLR